MQQVFYSQKELLLFLQQISVTVTLCQAEIKMLVHMIRFQISQSNISNLKFEGVLTNADYVSEVNTKKNDLKANLLPIFNFCFCHSVLRISVDSIFSVYLLLVTRNEKLYFPRPFNKRGQNY